jgi:hypothetical protein
MKQISPDYLIAYNKRDEAMDKYRVACSNLPECQDFNNADKMRDARLAVYIAAREALPEFAEVMRLAALLAIEYNKGIWDKDKETQ